MSTPPSPPKRITGLHPAPAGPPQPPNEIRLWLNECWYVPVDDKGYVASECFEGAFGCVIEVHHQDEQNKRKLALKVPRLLADTTRENAYIWQMQVEERRVAEDVNQERPQDAAILRTEPLNNILQRPRQLVIDGDVSPEGAAAVADNDVQAQHGGVLFVNYMKGHKPRLANVRVVRGPAGPSTLKVTPEALAETFAGLKSDPKIWDELQRPPKAGGANTRFSTPSFLEINPNKAALHLTFGALNKVLELQNASEVWFCGLDSVVYEWANGTLQEALEKGHTSGWTLVQVYEAVQQVLKGLVTLHSQEYVHADIRPANIMAIGDLSNPASYCVGDYGSFSRFSYEPNEALSGGYTLVGAGPGKFRSSVFYAPERRGGTERETANVAILLRQTSTLRVVLGWNSDLRRISPDDLTMRVNNAKEITLPERAKDEMLTKGDRIRIRDYIFDIIAEPKHSEPGAQEQFIVYECAPKFATVMHERMAILNQDETLPPFSIVTLPSYLEIRQWSCATDIYGVGTIALYCLYRNRGSADAGARSPVDGDSVGSWSTSSHQAEFAELVETLENRATADQLWPSLEKFRRTLEGDRTETQEIPKEVVDAAREAAAAPTVADPAAGAADPSTPRDDALQIARSLLNAHPAMQRILDFFSSDRILAPEDAPANWPEQTKYNVAYFLMFVHFVMSSLHHRSYLKVPETAKYPFCQHRRERTPAGLRERRAKRDPRFATEQKELPSYRALQRMRRLKQYCEGGHWSDFWVDRTTIVGSPADQDSARNIIDLWSKHETYRAEAHRARERQTELTAVLDDLNRHLQALKGHRPGWFDAGRVYEQLVQEMMARIGGLNKILKSEPKKPGAGKDPRG